MRPLKILIFLLIITPSIRISAQNMRFSFLANPCIVWLNQNDNATESAGALVGFESGIVTDFFFADKYAFSTGLFISQSGGKLIYTDSINLRTGDGDMLIPAGTTMKLKYQYIGVPVGLKFKTIEIGYTTFWLNLGLTPMVNIGSSVSTEDKSLDKSNLSREARMLNMDYFIRAGFEYSLGGETALIGGVGFHSGFADITKSSGDHVFTNSVSLVLGVLF